MLLFTGQKIGPTLGQSSKTALVSADMKIVNVLSNSQPQESTLRITQVRTFCF
jgi:hypothetical protein